ncbi:nucleoside diphosphate kinase homolog 5 [Callorhinchus milii]|uniref:nucleoside diphosphate kinase homolog 5 n=1 Tax=Callorhinchus milii TaxID=7868 RepID=UPI000457407D|nr:nucleoside diphosphate kinase homolog 5 [Callorhinchus milii]XP_042200787.1 nucleoside diphosphate kinase homolog 5 [Callorhinchus milii]XP_042200788.1 nucleoside diphosphate kinase homolog 5 [Callorhinchus milii]|eukprot:gi/632987095/ref/XP_007910601.1/ PREDICTED: nucleoside diphosphate kinase homolog 5-like [Callorhinchus milii]
MAGIRIYVEVTLAMIKPDAMEKALEIENIILQSGFTILKKRKVHLSPEECSELYAEHSGKMFFPSLTAHMSSGPIIAMMLARNKAISYWKELLGPADSMKAKETHPNSLRAIYGTDKIRNGLHGSECFNTAEKEISLMFPAAILEPFPTDLAAKDFLSKFVNPTLLTGLTELCKEKPAEPVIWLADWLMDHNPNKAQIQNTNLALQPCPM